MRFFSTVICTFAILSICIFILKIKSCDRYYEDLNKRRVEELKCINELKIAKLRLIYEIESENNTTNRICVFRHRLDERGSLSYFDSYGQENLFFNPDMNLWSELSCYYGQTNTEQLKKAEIRNLAVALKMKPNYFLCVRFDGSYYRTNTLPISWEIQ